MKNPLSVMLEFHNTRLRYCECNSDALFAPMKSKFEIYQSVSPIPSFIVILSDFPVYNQSPCFLKLGVKPSLTT